MECIHCDGTGCDKCDQGKIEVVGCPQKLCSSIVPTVRLIDLFNKGLPPVSGGTLDQSAWFLDAVSVFASEEALARTTDDKA